MALTIHAPHLPHLDDWTRRRTIVIAGVGAAAIALASIVVLQQAADESTSSATTAAGSAAAVVTGELLTPADGPGSNSLSTGSASAESAAPIAAPTKQALASSAAVVDTREFIGVYGTPSDGSSAESQAAVVVDGREFVGVYGTPSIGSSADSLGAESSNSPTNRQGHIVP